jgi:hypothetical protein
VENNNSPAELFHLFFGRNESVSQRVDFRPHQYQPYLATDARASTSALKPLQAAASWLLYNVISGLVLFFLQWQVLVSSERRSLLMSCSLIAPFGLLQSVEVWPYS